MAANSTLRRVLKRLLHPVLNERYYCYFQAAAMAWDICIGSYPEPEVRLIPSAVVEGDTVLDIGANYGFYSYHLSRAVGRTGLVYAFEPVPFTKSVLELVSKILRFRRVEIVAKGCGDQAKSVIFEIPMQASGAISAGLAHISTRDKNREQEKKRVTSAETREIECEVITLDDFLPPILELSFIKCDIEGAELLAFRGAERTIRQHHPTILCEIDHRFLERAKVSLGDLTSFFFSKGYKMYKYNNHSLRLTQVSELENKVNGNYIFIHPLRRDRLANLIE